MRPYVGRHQRQIARCLLAANGEPVRTSELMAWCWPEPRKFKRWHWNVVIRAAHPFGENIRRASGPIPVNACKPPVHRIAGLSHGTEIVIVWRSSFAHEARSFLTNSRTQLWVSNHFAVTGEIDLRMSCKSAKSSLRVLFVRVPSRIGS
jgi:hypothetical protein